MPPSTTVRVFETVEEVARTAAEHFVERASNAVSAHGRFAVALAGGSTPRLLYQLLASDFRDRLEWTTVHLFFGDERCVSRDHPDSNYRMAYESLIAHVEIPASNVHPIKGDGDPTTSAHLYEAELREFFRDSTAPAFDLVLLGLGDDGHTASLFPATSALTVGDKWAAANWVEKLQTHRITLTPTAINSAAGVTFLVTGGTKAPAVKSVLTGPWQPERLPAQLIKPEAGTLTWLLDSQAAALLPRNQQFT
jgi:6-phosphogluconolactonase